MSRSASACRACTTSRLWEALRESPIRLVGVRHEQAAAYAADGYARASGKLGVALTTTGPGAANTLGAVGEAWASRTPILVIATDIPTTLRRPGVYRGVLHETSGQADMFRPVTRAVTVVEAPHQLASLSPPMLAPPGGPAYLEVPTDLLAGEVRDGRGRLDDLRARGDRARRSVPPDRRRRAPADLGRVGRARPRGRGAGARRAARRAGPDHLRRARRAPARPSLRRRHAAARANPPAGSGTRPTW